MSKLLTLKEGVILTRFARQVIENHLIEKKELPLPDSPSEALQDPRGVFVTLRKRSSLKEGWKLRGCIGHLQPGPNSPRKPISLLEATRQAALSSALDDPRFPPVQVEEMKSILVETSVLTLPEEVIVKNRNKVAEQIAVGKDGLIIQGRGWHRGLLLPQVAPEQGWNAEEFLQGCCQKAGLPNNCYLDSETRILKFQAQIFTETTPDGEIEERKF